MKMNKIKLGAAAGLSLMLLWACTGSSPKGIYLAQVGPGPKVVFNLDHKPFPEIPLPNDLATRIDPNSPTGRRLNISEEASTELERRVRRALNTIEGFGIYQPIAVQFDKPLDLQNIIDRHHNVDFYDDAVYLINVTRGTRNYGKATLLDFGQGHFPLIHARPDRYYPNDSKLHVNNLLYDTVDEDLNNDGILQLTEDTDGDGVLDKPNVFPAGGDPTDQLLTFFEKETNTLVFRPVVPLEQETTYAVVLTKRLIGEGGNPVNSPFPYINHIRQNGSLKNLGEVLRNYGLTLDDVGYVWTYTTHGPTRDLEALRRGMYGHGAFSYLKDEFPARMNRVILMQDEGDNRQILPAAVLFGMDQILDIALAEMGGSRDGVDDLIQSYKDYIDYFIAGEYKAPNLLVDRDGIATAEYPADNDEMWEINRVTGEALYGTGKVIFFCAVPKAETGNGPPFPTVIYSHGYTSVNLELLAFASNLGKFGIASCVINAMAHGPPFNQIDMKIIADLIKGLGLGGFAETVMPGRARDLTNDGKLDTGGDFWTSDSFHTRDMIRQTILEDMFLVRLLRSFDGKRRWPAGLTGLDPTKPAGDFNGDGIVDLGGPNNDYFAMGTSLGGIMTGILAGIEPCITAAASNAGGAGLIDIALRSELSTAIDPVFLRVMGLVIVGEPVSGGVKLSYIVPDANEKLQLAVHTSATIQEGDLVRVFNLNNGETDHIVAGAGGAFRLQVASDTMDSVEKRALLGFDPNAPGFQPVVLKETTPYGDPLRIVVYDGTDMTKVKETIETFGNDVTFHGTVYPQGKTLIALGEGFGVKRNTPDLRKLFMLSQLILEPADAIAYAPGYYLNPLKSGDYDTAQPGVNMLMMPTNGDMTVPVSAGIGLARAAGMVELFEPDHRYGKTVSQMLIDNYVYESLNRMKRYDNDTRFKNRTNVQLGNVNLDVDNLSDTDMDGVLGSGDGQKAPRLDPPLRLTMKTPKGTMALRLPYMRRQGQHVFDIPNPSSKFDMAMYMINMVGRYFFTRGQEIRDEPCMAKNDCAWLPKPPVSTP